MRIGDVLTPESRVAFQKTLAGFRKRGRMRGLEVEFVRSDGSTFPALLNATAGAMPNTDISPTPLAP